MVVKVGAIGLGGLGYIELNVLDEMDDVEIVGGADVSREARASFESKFGPPTYESYEVMLEEHAKDLDAATIVTPHALHYDQAMACLEAGLDVFLEKPMVTGTENAVELVDYAAQQDRVVQVGYQRHFHPAFEEIKRIVDRGRIGDVHMANCFLGQDWIDNVDRQWRVEPELSGGGQLYDSGSHLLDALLWTTQTEPRNVAAIIERYGHDVDVNSALSVQLERDGRTIPASISVTANGTASSDPEEGLFLWGTDGHVAYDGTTITVVERDNLHYTADVTDGTDFDTLARQKLRNFVDAVRGEEDPAVPATVGLQVTALTEAAYEAAETGTTVDVQREIEEARERLRNC